MFRPLLRGRAVAPARLPDCDCAARLAAVEARLALVEGRAAARPPAKAKSTAKPAARAAPPRTSKPDPDPPRDARGWPQGYEVEVRQF